MKCNCKEHYLELFDHFDENASVYHRYCYKCGKWWWEYKWTKKKEEANTKIIRLSSVNIHHNAGALLPGTLLYEYDTQKIDVICTNGRIIQLLN